MEMLFQAVGVLGAGLIIVAYFMQQYGRWSVEHLWYHLFNLLGAGGILISLLHEWNLAQFVIEFFWIVVTLIGVWRWRRRAGRAS